MSNPSWAIWDSLDDLTIEQWAYLLCEIEPLTDSSKRPAVVLAMSDMLYKETQSGRLQYRDTSYYEPPTYSEYDDYAGPSDRGGVYFDGDIYIARKDIITWCGITGRRPKCLFSDERKTESHNVDNKINDSTSPKADFIWNATREKDEWTPALGECAKAFHDEYGEMPDEHQLWLRLIEKPPKGYSIQHDEKTKTLTMPGSLRIQKKDVARRLERYTKK